MLYDGFGGVLTSTLPLTLTGTLPDMPDAATGLVHLGGGRWYDPALGRPLQPNPAGGPPTVPQALNRYAATAVGQPGVYQAAANSGSLGADIGNSTASNTVGAILGERALGPTAIHLTKYLSPLYLMNISVSGPSRGTRGLLSRLLNEGPTNYSTARRLANGRLSSFSGLVFSQANVDDLATRLGQRGPSVRTRSLGRGVSRALNSFGGELAVGVVADVIIGGLWQGVSDAINYPGLSPALASRRMAAASTSNAINGVVGGTIGTGVTLFAFAVVEASPVGWVVTIGGIAGAVIWDISPQGQSITNYIFDKFNTDINRGLQPLMP